MFPEIIIFIFGVFLTVSLVCGILLWKQRKEVPDRSRTYFSLLSLLCSACVIVSVTGISLDLWDIREWTLLDPLKSFAGLYAITLATGYPIEVMRPGQLRGRWLFLLWLPSIIVTLPMVFGFQFQLLHSWADLREHIFEWDVLIRFLSIAFLFVYSIILLVIPYNWRRSSADYQWVRRFTLFAQGTTLFYCGNVFINNPIFPILHILWGTCGIYYFTYFERHIRVIPSPNSQIDSSVPESFPSHVNTEEVDETTYDYWPMICQMMDEWEIWRNPNTTVETLCTAIGTNRIYVARCIKEHTGMTFNDYMNEKRISYMAAQLRLNPAQDHKHLYFDVGFRNRHTAYRNFVKFIGSSPTDFIASLS